MNRKLQVIFGIVALVIIGTSFGLLAMLRVDAARQFSKSYRVQTYTGTNYVVQLLETTVGRVDTGHVVIVYARFENPNPTEIVLKREWFVLVDHDKDYFQPTVGGTQSPLIRLPPNGVSEKEALSYAVHNDSFGGTLALEIGHHHFVLLKNDRPWTRQLRAGQFVTFRTRDW